jgi:type VI secretion system protein ImpB
MSEDGTQKWIGRNRPPRVQITYDLETGGALVKTELPLVVGIIADLSGKDNTAPSDVAALKGQKFIEIDRDNFDDVMKSIKPTINLKAFGQPAEAIIFETIDDFTPDRLVEKVKALNDVLKTRQKLNDLLVAVDRNEALGDDLLNVAKGAPATTPPAVTTPPAATPPATPPPATPAT